MADNQARETQATKAPAGRVRREKVGTRSKFPRVEMEPGYQYRFVNDVDDRVNRFEDNGWEMVENSSVKRNTRRTAADATPEGSLARISVGQGTKAYLMRQKDEWFQEDQREKQNQIDMAEASMKQDARSKGLTGTLEITRG